MRLTVISRIALSSALCLVGCRVDPATQKAEVIDKGIHPPVQTAPSGPTGSIRGSILFTGRVLTATIDTSMDPACALGGGSDRLPVEQIATTNGKLANVFIYIKSGPPAAMQPGAPAAQPVVMDQQHCRYVPHVVALVAGGAVEFRNSDLTMHNIHTLPTQVGNETVDISQGPRGAPVRKQFLKPEVMIPVRCNNHPWMSAFINVSATPFFAVSNSAGGFEINGLPPGDYVLAAVQEKLGEKTMQVTVAPNAVSKAEFSYTTGN